MMEYLFVPASCFAGFLSLLYCVFLGRRIKRLETRTEVLQTKVDYLEKRVGDAIDLATESRREAERTEKKFFEGVSNIMNYDMAQARKGAGHGE